MIKTAPLCALMIFAIIITAGCASPKVVVTDTQPLARTLIDECSRYPEDSAGFYAKIDELGAKLLSDSKVARGKRVAITDFSDMDGNVTYFSRHLTEEMITRLGGNEITLVERALLDKALGELRLNNTDLFNPESAKRFGELTGADVILTGTITDMEKTLRINSRIIETDTARILATAGVEVLKTSPICRMLRKNVTAVRDVLSSSSSARAVGR